MDSTSWHSYPSIFALGHRAVRDLFSDPVLIEEKVDGSQFSFGRFGGELKVRSKGAVINAEYPEKMFSRAVEVVKGLDLHDGWTYRAEYLQKPKHNTLAYDRVPNNHLILFDINTDEEVYLAPEVKSAEAQRLGLETVPVLHYGVVDNPEALLAFLERTSILGGQKIEGVVVKNYFRFGTDKKALMGKYVSEAFKEAHSGEWRKANPTQTDVLQGIITAYRTEARWNKAIQHVREAGKLEMSPRDIGFLMKEIHADLDKECTEDIKDALYQTFIARIKRGVAAGFAEYYKEWLLKQQFANEEVQ